MRLGLEMPSWSVVDNSSFHLKAVGVCVELVVIVNLLVLEYNNNLFSMLAFLESTDSNFPFNQLTVSVNSSFDYSMLIILSVVVDYSNLRYNIGNVVEHFGHFAESY